MQGSQDVASLVVLKVLKSQGRQVVLSEYLPGWHWEYACCTRKVSRSRAINELKFFITYNYMRYDLLKLFKS